MKTFSSTISIHHVYCYRYSQSYIYFQHSPPSNPEPPPFHPPDLLHPPLRPPLLPLPDNPPLPHPLPRRPLRHPRPHPLRRCLRRPLLHHHNLHFLRVRQSLPGRNPAPARLVAYPPFRGSQMHVPDRDSLRGATVRKGDLRERMAGVGEGKESA